MAWIIVGAFAFGLYLVLRIGSQGMAWLAGGRHRAYRLVASRYHGAYERQGLYDPPTVSFQHGGAQVRVGLAPQVSGQKGPKAARTRVVARFSQGLPLRIELAPASRRPASQPPKGTCPVQVGDLVFDRGYSIQSNDPEMARAWLSPAVRWSLAKLERLAPPGGLLVSVNPERLLVQVDRDLGQNGETLLDAVSETLVIFDGMQQAVNRLVSSGISIVAAGTSALDDTVPPLCKVCGESILAPSVLCATCKTPHHRDCWEFIGSCSIYGCNGRTSLPA